MTGVPGVVQNVLVSSADPYSLAVTWARPLARETCSDMILEYNILCTDANGNHHNASAQSNSTFEVTIDNLHPYTYYNCCVSAVSVAGRGDSDCGSGRTNETGNWFRFITFANLCDILIPYIVPSGPPQGITGTALSSTKLLISWSPPLTEERNGVIRMYKIGISEAEAETGQTDYMYTSDNTTLKTLYSQHPYYHYNITVAAYTIGYGPFSHPAVRVHMLEAGKKHLAM